MIIRVFFILIVVVYGLFAESRVDTKIELGIYLPSINGVIDNHTSSADLASDFDYNEGRASYFAIDIAIDYPYVPNISIDYFYMMENSDAQLGKTVVVADGTFSSKVSSVVNFNVFNIVLYQDFKQKGSLFSFFGKQYYTGDFEFDVGMNGKYILWNYEVQDRTNLNTSSSWVNVSQFIPLPYIGFKYFLYNFSFYSDVSALSFVEAKSMNYQVGISYKVIEGLSLSTAYLYEEFEAVEKEDTINFSTAGYKVSFMYEF